MPADDGSRGKRPAAPHGFTLIEVLVVIGVIALLVALAIPALAAVRRSGRQTQSLSNLRGIGQTFELYQATYRCYPFGTGGLARPPETGIYAFGFNPWLIDRCWPVLMHQTAPWPECSAIWLSPGANRNRFSRTWSDTLETFTTTTVSYHYSRSFIASPELWDGRASASPSMIRAISGADVEFPSAKVLCYDNDRAYLKDPASAIDPRPVLLTDGSARVAMDSDAVAPVQNPLDLESPRRFQDTPLGVHGRDF